jgi:hypothetical protein
LLNLMAETSGSTPTGFPLHGVVGVETEDLGKTWRELWRLEAGD